MKVRAVSGLAVCCGLIVLTHHCFTKGERGPRSALVQSRPLDAEERDNAARNSGTRIPFESKLSESSDEHALAPASASLLIIVVDEQAARIPDVEVFRGTNESVVWLGITDHEGCLEAPSSVDPFSVIIRGARIRTREQLVLDPIPKVVEIVAQYGESLTGRVALANDNLPAPEGTLVIAWPSRWRFPPDVIAARVRTEDPRIAMARTRDQGEFEIRGLQPQKEYSLLALTPGWASWPARHVRVGDYAHITLNWILGVDVVIQGPDGEPPLLDPMFRFYGRLPLSHLHVSGATYLPTPNLIGLILGDDNPPAYGDPTRFQLLYACTTELETLGPISYEAHLPGYGTESFTLYALPTDRGLHRETIRLPSVDVFRRDVRIEFTDVPDAEWQLIKRRGGVGRLEFDSPQESASVEVHNLEGAITVHTVPSTLKFARFFPYDEPSATISSSRQESKDGSEVWRISLAGLGVLKLEFLLPDSTIYFGPACLVLERDSAPETFGAPALFDRSPYLFLRTGPRKLRGYGIYPSVDLSGESEDIMENRSLSMRYNVDWQ